MNLIPDLTILPMWLIFIASYIVLNTLVLKPTLAILEERKKRSVGLDKEAKYFIEEAQKKLQKYESLMKEAHDLARSKREEILKQASLERKEIVDEARVHAEQHLTQVKQEVEKQAKQASEQIESISQSLAKDMLDRLIDRKVA